MNIRWILALLVAGLLSPLSASAAEGEAKPIKVLIITGDHAYHNWQQTTPLLKEMLTKAGMSVDVTETPAKDLTAANLAKYDALLLNYRDFDKKKTETIWSDENKKAFADAIKNGKGLLVYHYASSAFTSGDEWSKEFERIIAGGWRKQGFHGKRHEYNVKVQDAEHPITKGMPTQFKHASDELYQNSMLFPDCHVIATAYSDPAKDPKNTGKDEPMVWVTKYGQGRVCENALGHDPQAMDLGFQTLLIRGVEWVASGEVKYAVPTELMTNTK
jgi:type 1 glutamine amidotransferase